MFSSSSFFFLLLSFYSSWLVLGVRGDLALLETIQPQQEISRYCVIYNELFGKPPQLYRLPLTLAGTEGSEEGLGCVEEAVESRGSGISKVGSRISSSSRTSERTLSSSIAFVYRGNCSFSVKALFAQHQNASAVLIINYSSELFLPEADQSRNFTVVNIPVGIIGQQDAEQIFSRNYTVMGSLYVPSSSIDPNSFIIVLIGVFLIVCGSHWAVFSPLHVPLDIPTSDEPLFVFDVKTVFCYVVTASALLVVLYFLYQYAVYIIVGLFLLGSLSGMYMCLSFILSFTGIPNGKSCTVQWLGEITVKSCCLLVLSSILPVCWVILRNSWAAWILQDLLGSCIILSIFRTVRLPNFKIAVILLSLFFVYDIFFVFITPFFTEDGKSIMVKVATGGSWSHESPSSPATHSKTGGNTQLTLPLTIMIPHLLDPYQGACGSTGYSILGFGDIILPGLVVSYCLFFDTMQQTWKNKIYFLISLLAYVTGLGFTYVALLLMKMAQPALLYLVPCVLSSVALLAWKRDELSLFWSGLEPEPRTVEQLTETETSINSEQQQSTETSQNENIPLMSINSETEPPSPPTPPHSSVNNNNPSTTNTTTTTTTTATNANITTNSTTSTTGDRNYDISTSTSTEHE